MQSHATIKWLIKYITKKSFNILYKQYVSGHMLTTASRLGVHIM